MKIVYLVVRKLKQVRKCEVRDDCENCWLMKFDAVKFGRYQHFRGTCFVHREECSFSESVKSRYKIHISVTRTPVKYHCRFLWRRTSPLHVTWSLGRWFEVLWNSVEDYDRKMIFLRELTETVSSNLIWHLGEKLQLSFLLLIRFMFATIYSYFPANEYGWCIVINFVTRCFSFWFGFWY
jgi:hypothetical protein